MSTLFVSYRRDDSLDITGRMCDWLTQRMPSAQIFVDVDSIPPGDDFRAVMERAIQHADIVLVVIGQRWLEITDDQGRRRLDDPDDYVRTEIRMALERNVPVIPLLVHGALMPPMGHLPSDLSPLAFRNALPVRSGPDFTHDMERMVRAIQAYVPDLALTASVAGPAAGPAAGHNTTTAGTPQRQTSLIWINLIAALSVLGVVCALVCFGLLVSGEAVASTSTTLYFIVEVGFVGVWPLAGVLGIVAVVLVCKYAIQVSQEGALAAFIVASVVLGPLALAGVPALVVGLRWRSSKHRYGAQSRGASFLWTTALAAFSVYMLCLLCVVTAFWAALESRWSSYLADYFTFCGLTLPFAIAAVVLATRDAVRRTAGGQAIPLVVAAIFLTPLGLCGLLALLYAFRKDAHTGA